ncbi:MAG: TraR/DksA C4-type zinc finger protein [Pseudomonadota bacterium]
MTEDEARTALIARRTELEEEGWINAEGREPVTLQQDSVGRLSRIDAIQQQAMAQAQEHRRANAKRRVAAALDRLNEGEWGYCVTCGEDIAPARLKHDPSVATCVVCAGGG